MFKKINHYIHKLFEQTMSTIYFITKKNVIGIYWDARYTNTDTGIYRCKEKEFCCIKGVV